MKDCRITETELAAWLEDRLTQERRQELEALLADRPEVLEECFGLAAASWLSSGDMVKPLPSALLAEAVQMYGRTHDNGGALYDLILGFCEGTLRLLSHSSGIGLLFPEQACALRTAVTADADTIIVRKTFGDIEAELDIEHRAFGVCGIRVVLRSDEGLTDKHYRVELISGNRVLASERMVNGSAVFEAITPGRYSIIFRKDLKSVGELRIKIAEPLKEDGND